MKKLFLVSISILISMFIGCVSVDTSSAVIYDESIPTEELCYLAVPNYIKVTQFNGNDVTWQGAGMANATVGIPSGENTLVFDYTQPTGSGNITHRNKRAVFNFEAGKTYYLRGQGTEVEIVNM